MDVRSFVELIAALMMPAGGALVFWERMRSGRGLGARAIQYTAVVIIVPLIIILALEKVLEANIIGTLLGALSGYLLTGISAPEQQSPRGQRAGPGEATASGEIDRSPGD